MVLIIGNCIPKTISLFATYIRNTNDYLQQGAPITNAERLGVPPAHAARWKEIEERWQPAFIKYSDKINSRTAAVTNQLYDIIDMAHEFEQETHMFAYIAISRTATTTDMETFCINKRTPKSTHFIPQTPVGEQVDAILQPIGGGVVSVKCFSGGKRASIHKDATCVEYRYKVGAIAPSSPIDTNLMVDQCTKSSFTLNVGAENSGLRLYIYFRWFNTKHPELAGPWCDLQNTLIL